MQSLDRLKLLQKEKLEIVKVELSKDECVYVRQMTGRERDRFEQSLIKEVKDAKGNTTIERSLEDFRAKLAVCTLCDEKGESLLQPADAAILSQHMSAARLEKIVNKAQELNAITEADKEALVKNLDAGQAGNSNLGSVEK
jgi:hypothetical protein